MFTNLRERLSFYSGEILMVAKKKSTSTNDIDEKIKKIEKENTKKMSTLQRKICRDIIDAGDVTKSQVNSELIKELQDRGSTREELKKVLAVINSRIDTQTNQLVDRVVKAFE